MNYDNYGRSALAKLLDDQIIPDKTLTALRQAIRYARLANEKTIALNYVEQQVRPYYDLGMYDSVYSICSQLSMDYQREGMKEEAIHAQGSRIYVDLLKGNYSNLDTLLTGYLKAVRTLGYDEGYAYSLKAKYHQGTGNLDSAIICYRRQLELTEVLAEKTVPYRGLYQCYKALGRSDSANKYNELYCMANDSSVIFKYRTTMQRMQHLYDYSHFQTMAHQKSLENERLHSSLYALAALLVLIIAVGIAIFKRIQTKRNRQYAASMRRTITRWPFTTNCRKTSAGQVQLHSLRNIITAQPVESDSNEHKDPLAEEAFWSFRWC